MTELTLVSYHLHEDWLENTLENEAWGEEVGEITVKDSEGNEETYSLWYAPEGNHYFCIEIDADEEEYEDHYLADYADDYVNPFNE